MRNTETIKSIISGTISNNFNEPVRIGNIINSSEDIMKFLATLKTTELLQIRKEYQCKTKVEKE